MKSTLLLSSTFILVFSHLCYSQEYSYTHYDVGDGLAGSVVYCITQDKDGFMWAGTETGVSRFDGTHFKTFTAADGLPDIEVLEMFGDSKGRVWMAPFRKSVCYYYQGRIHNQENDPLLHCIHLRENVENFAEDAAGNILILEKTALHWYGSDGAVREFDSIGGHPIHNATAISRSLSGHFLVQADLQLFDFSLEGSTLFRMLGYRNPESSYIAMEEKGMIYRSDQLTTTARSFVTGKTVRVPFDLNHYKHFTYTAGDDSLFYINELSGSTEININSGVTKHYLPGIGVSKTFRDPMGNTWFTTMGQGIYRLNSDEFRTMRIHERGIQAASVDAITRGGDVLLVGDDHNSLFTFLITGKGLGSQTRLISMTGKNRFLFLDSIGPNEYLGGSDVGLSLEGKHHEGRGLKIQLGVKALFKKNNYEFIVGSNWGVGLFDLRKLRITDTLWRERATAIYSRNDTVYIGTLNGLYQLAPDRSSVFMGEDIPFLKKRISAMAESSDGTLWIASYDGGVIGYKDGRVLVRIDKQSGLSSDICRTILLQKNVLWIGTDKGLNRVALDMPGYPVIHYTSKDGLGSDIINTIYIGGSIVYVGTPAGLSYFDQTKVDVFQGCRLHLLSVINSGKDRIRDTTHLEIPYRDKHVRLEFAAISYRSVGDIQYRYRMLGLDSIWQETQESFLEYPILPSGPYVFQLQAINKFGIRSNLLSLPLEVATPFWQAAWFYLLILVLFFLLVGFFVNLRIKYLRRRQEAREQFNQRVAELENTAIQSQMNPHFIFNCLNSIQHYIFDQETLAANKYLTGFARLIRATLHNSSKTFISLADEVDYLSTYLSLEKLRFKEKMEFVIEVDPSIDKNLYLIPPMLIQPFAENSMRHGLRHKTDGKGFIQVRFEKPDNRLWVTVEDNGIGRKKAAGYQTREHIEYQSKGMSLTADRIRLMNVKYGNDIRIEVTDLEDRGQATGTRVVLKFPLFHIANQKEMI